MNHAMNHQIHNSCTKLVYPSRINTSECGEKEAIPTVYRCRLSFRWICLSEKLTLPYGSKGLANNGVRRSICLSSVLTSSSFNFARSAGGECSGSGDGRWVGILDVVQPILVLLWQRCLTMIVQNRRIWNLRLLSSERNWNHWWHALTKKRKLFLQIVWVLTVDAWREFNNNRIKYLI